MFQNIATPFVIHVQYHVNVHIHTFMNREAALHYTHLVVLELKSHAKQSFLASLEI